MCTNSGKYESYEQGLSLYLPALIAFHYYFFPKSQHCYRIFHDNPATTIIFFIRRLLMDLPRGFASGSRPTAVTMPLKVCNFGFTCKSD